MVQFAEFWALLEQMLGDELKLRVEQAQLLYGHYCQLVRWGRIINLVRLRDWREAVARHYAESLFLAAKLPRGLLRILDVGSGGGFPGIPIAAARTECEIVLAESRHRKAAFLREATREWVNVRVHFGRAEQLRERFDWVVARAVRPEDAAKVARLVGARMAWLGAVSEAARPVQRLGQGAELRWESALPLPWAAERGVLLGAVVSRGEVSRGTSENPSQAPAGAPPS